MGEQMNMATDQGRRATLKELREQNASLQAAIVLLHRIANLVQAATAVETACHALLTGVTAGTGLGMNRAMLFVLGGESRDELVGAHAVGPADGLEAERAWQSLEGEGKDLEDLVRQGPPAFRNRLEQIVRATTVAVAGDSPVSLALRLGCTVTKRGADDLGGLLHLPTAIAAPLRGRSGIRGVLYADSCFTGRRLDQAHQLVFGLLADQAGQALENAARFESMAHAARTDSLTGLGNHGSFMSDLGRLVRQARKGEPAFAVLMLDLDDFKKVNDQYGHLAGDALLAEAACRIVGCLRSGDRAYRYGGDEFAVILGGGDPVTARQVAGRILEQFSCRPFEVATDIRVPLTCTVGVAATGQGELAASDLVALADAALMASKSAGKNRVG